MTELELTEEQLHQILQTMQPQDQQQAPQKTQPDQHVLRQQIQQKRAELIDSPENLLVRMFTSLYPITISINHEFFCQNASNVVTAIRLIYWEAFTYQEREFSRAMTKVIFSDPQDSLNLQSTDLNVVINTIADHFDDFYALSLSNTQSRRSRTGKVFEKLIELLLIHAGIPVEPQGLLKSKRVDLVIPCAAVFGISHPEQSIIISAKTTLRERWQEVIEEVTRIGTKNAYLATADEWISPDTIEKLSCHHIKLVTTQRVRDQLASDIPTLSFEDMIREISEKLLPQLLSQLDHAGLSAAKQAYQRQLERYQNWPNIRDFYQQEIAKLDGLTKHTP